jgi:small subunit ribosomal protein S20
MATHSSAIKRIRRNARRRTVNRRNIGRMRTAIKALRAVLAARNVEQARPLVRSTISLIDRLVRKGTIHRNAAARHKSRLSGHLRRLESAGASR